MSDAGSFSAPNTVLNADGSVAAGTGSYQTSAANGEPVPQQQVPHVMSWEQWSGSINALGDRLSEKLDGLNGTVREATAQPTPEPPAVDLEAMTNSELMAHMIGTFSKVIDDKLGAAIKPVHEAASQAQLTAATADLNRTIDNLRATHKDFGDWKDEMVALAKEYPALTIPRLYALAKAENPQKAEQLHVKYNPPPPPRPRPIFGGLVPGGQPGSTTVKPLSPQEASYEAYAEVQARHPDILAALNRM